MTNAQPNDDIERRLSCLENLMSSHGELLIQPASLARHRAADFNRIQEILRRMALN
jgi:hypothetical protein